MWMTASSISSECDWLTTSNSSKTIEERQQSNLMWSANFEMPGFRTRKSLETLRPKTSAALPIKTGRPISLPTPDTQLLCKVTEIASLLREIQLARGSHSQAINLIAVANPSFRVALQQFA